MAIKRYAVFLDENKQLRRIEAEPNARIKTPEGWTKCGKSFLGEQPQAGRRKMSEFYGTVKFTPAFAKCNPLYIRGHWTSLPSRGAWIEILNGGPHDETCKHCI